MLSYIQCSLYTRHENLQKAYSDVRADLAALTVKTDKVCVCASDITATYHTATLISDYMCDSSTAVVATYYYHVLSFREYYCQIVL
jgi:hypothetical protein